MTNMGLVTYYTSIAGSPLNDLGVEINIAMDDTYQILFDLGERGGKWIVDTNLTSYTYIRRKE